jgi:hypothetical protein
VRAFTERPERFGLYVSTGRPTLGDVAPSFIRVAPTKSSARIPLDFCKSIPLITGPTPLHSRYIRRNSRIVLLVNVERYDEVPRLQGTYFAYWRNVAMPQLELHLRISRGVYAFPTNDAPTPVGVN